jgi:hypothetical protein
MACGWGGFVGYGVAMLVSYFVGQKYYPIDYPLKDMALYVILAAAASAAMYYWRGSLPLWLALTVNSLVILLFVAVIVKRDLPLSGLPVIGKYFRK